MKKGYYGQAAGVFLSVLFIFFGFISGTAGISDPETAVLADFGGTAAENSFGVPGWNTVLKDRYTDYRAAGPGGTAISVGSEGTYNYQGVSGAVMSFAAGDRITAVWYSNSDETLTFTPKISFDDPDRSCMGETGTWYGMSTVTVPGRGTGESIFDFDTASAGAYGLANVSVNYSNSGVLVCDKILLTRAAAEPDTEAPSVPAGVTAEPASESQIRLFWDAVWDNIGVAGYRIYSEDGSEKGVSVNTEYTAGGLEPETEYTHTVTAYDAAGNESAHSEPVSASTLPAPDFTVLADFGAAAAENIFGLPGWETVLKDKYTDYRAAGPGGTTITVGSEGTYNYQGVSGTVMSFFSGDRITAVWYNDSDGTLTFSPKISFDDPDRSCTGTAGTWYGMGTVTVPGRSTGESVFEFDGTRAGAYGLVNISVNYSNSGVLICDKILLARIPDEPDTEAPSVPAGLTAEPVSDSAIRISWQPSSDGRGVSVYEIFRDGVSAGTAGETSYSDTGLSPLTEYAYTVRACDEAGNCSEQSAAVTAAAFGQISVSEAFAETCDDDAYETSDGSVSLTDSVLILGGDGAAGLRFSGIDIPRGAVITAAYIEFEYPGFRAYPGRRNRESLLRIRRNFRRSLQSASKTATVRRPFWPNLTTYRAGLRQPPQNGKKHGCGLRVKNTGPQTLPCLSGRLSAGRDGRRGTPLFLSSPAPAG